MHARGSRRLIPTVSQRYWHTENVGLLAFKSKTLAASVGCTVQELNKLPINPLATEVVFDALAHGNSGIIQRDLCDERRASWETAEGFDAAAFGKDLRDAKLNVVRSFCLFPGTIYATQAGRARERSEAPAFRPVPTREAPIAARSGSRRLSARIHPVAVFVKVDGFGQIADYLTKSQDTLGDNLAIWGSLFGLGSS